jgi:hypothetical protein
MKMREDLKLLSVPAVPMIISPNADNSSSNGSISDSLDNFEEAFSAWRTFKKSPKELWIILMCKLFESFSFISEDFSFMIFFHGLFFSGYLIDNAGVKRCMLLGSFLLFVSRFLLCIIETKRDLYLLFTTITPLGLSLCKLSKY